MLVFLNNTAKYTNIKTSHFLQNQRSIYKTAAAVFTNITATGLFLITIFPTNTDFCQFWFSKKFNWQHVQTKINLIRTHTHFCFSSYLYNFPHNCFANIEARHLSYVSFFNMSISIGWRWFKCLTRFFVTIFVCVCVFPPVVFFGEPLCLHSQWRDSMLTTC